MNGRLDDRLTSNFEFKPEGPLSEESVRLWLESLSFNIHGADQLNDRVRKLEKLVDTMDTPLLKKIVFVIDGWPLFRLVARPQWRPWRRWWTS